MISKTILKASNLPPVRLILKPGQRGTKKLIEQYGDRFVCVRYRYDPIHKVWELSLSTILELDLEDRIVFKEDKEKHL